MTVGEVSPFTRAKRIGALALCQGIGAETVPSRGDGRWDGTGTPRAPVGPGSPVHRHWQRLPPGRGIGLFCG